MTVNRDVILDLLPLYLAGEASAATRQIVDDYLAGDPALAEHVRREQARETTAMSALSPGADLELRALVRAKGVLALQRWLFGLAWFFTAITLTSEGTITHGRLEGFHLMIFDLPLVFGSTLLVAVGCWIGYYVLRGRARTVV